MRFVQLFRVVAVASLALSACSDSVGRGAGPVVPGQDSSGDATTDAGGLDGATDGAAGDALLDGSGQSDGLADGAGTDSGDGASTGDTNGDTGGLPDGVGLDGGPSDGQGNDGEGPDGDAGDGTDANDGSEPGDVGGDTDTEDPGTCETDEDCTYLTPQACCPKEPDPCGGEPAVGTLSEQDENIAWIAAECDPEVPCEEPEPPACDSCWIVEDYTPVCDGESKKCVLSKAPACEAICAAMGDPEAGVCPLVSNPALLSADVADDCGCALP